jgi:MFS family permease
MTRQQGGLDALNFFLADVRDGLGPYLAIYLLTVQKWDAASIGLVMSIGGIATILAQTPAGNFIDVTRYKRAAIIVAALLVTACCLVLPIAPGFLPVAIAQSLAGVASSIFAPGIAAITLGIMGPKAFTRRTGRNEAFNHAGNAVAAVLAGAGAYVMGPVAVFYLMAAMAACSIAATLAVPASAIDHDVARGLDDGSHRSHARPAGLSVLLENRPLLIFAGCVVLFHFANAAMLPLVGQKLALANEGLGTTLMAACVVIAQLVMIPAALIVGAKADDWGRKPLFLAGFFILTLRGALYPVSDDPYWLVGVQALDGVGAGIFGALFPVVVADLTRGTGRFNVSQGAIATALGLGAALSATFAGLIVVTAGYSAAFLALAAIAGFGLLIYAAFMPETRPHSGHDQALIIGQARPS